MSKEAIQKGIDALRGVIAWDIMRNHLVPYRVRYPIHEAIEALAALVKQPAQQEPEYAWPTVADYERDVGLETNQAFKMGWGMARTTNSFLNQLAGVTPQPAQRPWVGLTHDEYDAICDKHSSMSDFDFLEDIEAKLKEKNT